MPVEVGSTLQYKSYVVHVALVHIMVRTHEFACSPIITTS